MNEELAYEYGDKTILELTHLWEAKHLNLKPGFQRKSVWAKKDRVRLIQSLLSRYPIPSIFLYKREEDGRLVYDVIDGKQRLETIFMYTKASRFKRLGFEVKFQFDDDERPFLYDWKDLAKYKLTAPFMGSKIQVVEVSGDFASIVDLFVRINSTGKALTSAEKRHAKFYNSPFLKEALRLSKRYRRFFIEQRIVTKTQINRMKDIELTSELLASVNACGPINKKAAVDRSIGNTPLNGQTLNKVANQVTKVMNLMKKMFPDLRSIRFHNLSEFYTLFMVVWEMWNQKLILTNPKRNKIAEKLLRRFSSEVDRIKNLQVTLNTSKKITRLYADYLLTVQQSTDALAQRKHRAEIVRGIFGGIFAKKDIQRTFSSEQRRLLWNTEQKKKCIECDKILDWANFQVDHIKPYVKGGKTVLSNAALICAKCNKSKGARKKAKR